MKYLATLLSLTGFLGACVQSVKTPYRPTTPYLAGTVYAPEGGNVLDTVVFACFLVDDDCDEDKSDVYVLFTPDSSANFIMTNIEQTNYLLFAVKDINGNGEYGDTGDYFGVYGTDGQVSAPADNLAIYLQVVTDEPAPAPAPTPAPELEPFTVKGYVTDAAGRPMVGVSVFADNTAGYNTNVYGTTGADGFYQIDVSGIMPSSWRVGAYHTVTYHGVNDTLPLHPDNAAPFAGVDGAVRNLQWLLTGETPIGGYYGGLMRIYEDYMRYDLDMRYVELTLTPDGPLIDGSAGAILTLYSANGMDILDVPIGRYTVTARYTPPGEMASDLLLRVRDQGDYLTETTTLFRPNDLYGPLLELQLIRPD
jgi:hypothetical protein